MTLLGVPSTLSAVHTPVAEAGGAGSLPGEHDTMVGFAAELSADTFASFAVLGPAALAAAPKAEPQSAQRSMQQTMLGMKAPDLAQARPGMTQAIPVVAPAPPAAAVANTAILSANRTMLGVATPGIAPIHASEPPRFGSAAATMLGVAAPGIAPVNPGYSRRQPTLALAAPVLPAPPPLVDESLPPPPVFAPKSGIPVARGAAIAGVLLLCAAAVVWFAFRLPPPLSAITAMGADGKEQLLLSCEGCRDGTTVTLDGARATFAGHRAAIAVGKPLTVGDNPFELSVDRPAGGRDEWVKLTVPVSYLIRPDLSKLRALKPTLEITVNAAVGSTVLLSGAAVALDASGVAVKSIDLSAESVGEGDATTVEKKLDYAVTGPKGEKNPSGEVVAKIALPKLLIDAPGPRPTTQDATINVSGRTSRDTVITINGDRAQVGPDGVFTAKVPVPATDSPVLVVRAQEGRPDGAPRIVTIPVKHVASIALEAASLEKTVKLGWDSLSHDLESARGKDIIVEGPVLQSRTDNHCEVILVDDRRGCPSKTSQCAVRVFYCGGLQVSEGEVIRAYGVVRAPFAAATGIRVPEMAADFLLKGKLK